MVIMEKLLYTSKIKVRYYETDKMGVVHHSNYIRYFEVARTEAMAAIGCAYRDIENSGILMPVISVNCEYRFPAYYADELTVKTFLQRITGARMVFAYQVFNAEGKLLATGNTVLAFIHSDSRRPVRMPAAIRDILINL